MAINLDPSWHEPVRKEGKLRVAEVGDHRQVSRDGAEQLAHGALICPGCDAPISLPDRIPAGATLECGYCERRGRAREFVVADVYDTLANEVYLVARIA